MGNSVNSYTFRMINTATKGTEEQNSHFPTAKLFSLFLEHRKWWAVSCDLAKWRSWRGHLLTLRRPSPGKKKTKKNAPPDHCPISSLWVTLFITLLCFLSRFSLHLSSTQQLFRITLLPPSWAGRQGNALLQLIKINSTAAIFKGQVFYYLHWSVLYNSSPHIRLILNHLEAG